MIAISAIGVFLGIAALIFITWKGAHTMISSIIASLIVLISSRIPLWAGLVTGTEKGSFGAGLAGFVSTYFAMFLLGAIMGEILSRSGYALSIATTLIKGMGVKRALLAIILVTAVMTFGGVSMFVVIFTVYPIALYLCQEGDIPKPLFIGALSMGGATFTMTSLPGSPSVTNVVPTAYTGTSLFAAPVLGIIMSVVLFALGYIYLLREEKKYRKAGVHFTPHALDSVTPLTDELMATVPNFWMAIVPIVIVFVINVAAAVKGWDSNMAVCAGLLLAIIYIYATRWNKIDGKLEALNKGTMGSIAALLGTGAVMAFGAVVKSSAAFDTIVNFILNLPFPPLVSATAATGMLSGVVGSATGGLTLFWQLMGEHFISLGLDPAVLHRLTTVASGTFDSLPHSGAIVTFLLVTHLDLKSTYRHIFVVCCLVPIVAVAVGIICASLGIV